MVIQDLEYLEVVTELDEGKGIQGGIAFVTARTSSSSSSSRTLGSSSANDTTASALGRGALVLTPGGAATFDGVVALLSAFGAVLVNGTGGSAGGVGIAGARV